MELFKNIDNIPCCDLANFVDGPWVGPKFETGAGADGPEATLIQGNQCNNVNTDPEHQFELAHSRMGP